MEPQGEQLGEFWRGSTNAHQRTGWGVLSLFSGALSLWSTRVTLSEACLAPSSLGTLYFQPLYDLSFV